MMLYKYRELFPNNDEQWGRLLEIISRKLFWCAAPETLNDRDEFSWRCDYAPTDATKSLLTELLVRERNMPSMVAEAVATVALQSERFEDLCAPTVASIIAKCRSENGLVCFGTSPSNAAMWNRYGGAGSGVCIEVDAPSDLMNTQLHCVSYVEEKSMHIDQLLRAHLFGDVAPVYSVAYLCKPRLWSSEEEVRFVSRMQNVQVRIDRSRISRLIVGAHVDSETKIKLESAREEDGHDFPIHYCGA